METLHQKIADLEKQKQEFIKNFPTTKKFTTIKGETFTRKLYSFEADYPDLRLQEIIFTHGKTGYTLWFLNAKKKLCVIDKATIGKNDTIYLTVTIDAKKGKKQTYISLDRFLYLLQKGDFKITLKKFVDIYLKDIKESNYYKNKLNEFDDKIKELNDIISNNINSQFSC